MGQGGTPNPGGNLTGNQQGGPSQPAGTVLTQKTGIASASINSGLGIGNITGQGTGNIQGQGTGNTTGLVNAAGQGVAVAAIQTNAGLQTQNLTLQTELWADKVRQGAPDDINDVDVNKMVREFNEDKHVNFKSKWRRKNGYERRKGIYSSTAAQGWRTDGTDSVTAESYTKPKKATSYEHLADLKELLAEETDFMGYKNDEVFTQYFSALYGKLKKFDSVLDEVFGMNDTDFKALGKEYGLLFPSRENLEEKRTKIKKIREFYETKMDLISNPFYMVLRKTDTNEVTIEKLREKMDNCDDQSQEKLKKYLGTMIKLRELEEEGYVRTHEHRIQVARHDLYNGKKTRHKGYAEVLSLKSEHGGVLGVSTDGMGRDYRYSNANSGLVEKEERRAEAFKGATIGAEAHARVKAKGAKGSYKYKRDYFDFGVNGTLVGAQAQGSVGASLGYNVDSGFSYVAGAGVGAGGHLAKSRVKARLHFLKDLFGIDGKISGKVGTATAAAYAKAGTFNVETVDETKEIKNGIALHAGVEAAAATATASLGITIGGIRIGISASGQAGSVGASAGFYAGESGIGTSLGLQALLGFKVGIDVDWSVLQGVLKEWVEHFEPVKKIKKKVVKAVTEKYWKAKAGIKNGVRSLLFGKKP
ncbi:MAG: hypothetical protein IJP84_01415 [Lachnospiraceae bacterium]|nr:hypothetical protein [Lachnospiraceae bacterium]